MGNIIRLLSLPYSLKISYFILITFKVSYFSSLFILQGFNRIAAITLLFMHEEDAFWCLVFIIEHLMPVDYYSRDKQLIGAQVDQVIFVSNFFGYLK